jgi:cholesterol oxidase
LLRSAGCNVGAKNTLLMNYIPAAHSLGADVICGARVSHVSRGADGRFDVHVADADDDKAGLLVISAHRVVLAAGWPLLIFPHGLGR